MQNFNFYELFSKQNFYTKYLPHQLHILFWDLYFIQNLIIALIEFFHDMFVE